jgi:hypothetical protein
MNILTRINQKRHPSTSSGYAIIKTHPALAEQNYIDENLKPGQGKIHCRQVKPKVLRFSIAQTFRFGIEIIPNLMMAGRLRPYCP